MTDFVEAVVTLLPREAGGRQNPIAPRDGSYRPFLGYPGGERLRVRFIEGPPRLAPGDTGRVVLEIESADAGAMLVSGAELELFEANAAAIGLVTVARVVRGALAL
ncbi:MAG TPA: hypothetical protein VLU46_09925 [Thermoanaerobaculia bacterium]|nr:hypothetical protein [Thermoanaerobaculia bacterium]